MSELLTQKTMKRRLEKRERKETQWLTSSLGEVILMERVEDQQHPREEDTAQECLTIQ